MKHLHKQPIRICISLKMIIFVFLIMGVITLNASEPICEVYNIDTEQCESFIDQNVTFSDEWHTREFRPNAVTQESLKVFIDLDINIKG